MTLFRHNKEGGLWLIGESRRHGLQCENYYNGHTISMTQGGRYSMKNFTPVATI